MSRIPVYEGALADLRELLEREAVNAPGKWVRRSIATGELKGTLVALRVSPGRQQLNLCIGCEVAPRTMPQRFTWEDRVRRLLKELRATGWDRGEDMHVDEGVAATFATPFVGQHTLI